MLEGSKDQKELLAVLLLKCRDKDAKVRHASFDALAGMPGKSLLSCLCPKDWRTVLGIGLGVWTESSQIDAAADKHVLQLLKVYLTGMALPFADFAIIFCVSCVHS